jgi:hypothetical protein
MNIRQQKYNLKKLILDLNRSNDKAKLKLIEQLLVNNDELRTYYKHITNKDININNNVIQKFECKNYTFVPRYTDGIYGVYCTVCGGEYPDHRNLVKH